MTDSKKSPLEDTGKTAQRDEESPNTPKPNSLPPLTPGEKDSSSPIQYTSTSEPATIDAEVGANTAGENADIDHAPVTKPLDSLLTSVNSTQQSQHTETPKPLDSLLTSVNSTQQSQHAETPKPLDSLLASVDSTQQSQHAETPKPLDSLLTSVDSTQQSQHAETQKPQIESSPGSIQADHTFENKLRALARSLSSVSADKEPRHSCESQQICVQHISIANRKDGGVLYWTAKLYGFSAFVFLVVFFLAGVFTYRYFAKTIDDTNFPNIALYSQTTPIISKMYAADGTLLAEFANEWRELAPLDTIPQNLINAFLAAEDHYFYEHSGIYFRGILRALWRNIVAGDFAQGGSTITQQVAKQFLSSEKSLTRKIKEAIVARRLESTYSKDAILALYLNQIYLGNGAYGVKSAARRYFGKKLNDLSIGEIAVIAGLAQAPSRYSPGHHPKRATKRRNEILSRMARLGFIDPNTLAALSAEELVIAPHRETFGDYSPYYTEHLRRYVVENYGADALQKQGLIIEAAVEPTMDALAYENVDHGSRKQDKRQGWRGPVTTLDKKARAIFIQRATAMYGDRELDPSRRYLALVRKVGRNTSTVLVGSREYDLPLVNMRWASSWSSTDATNDIEIQDARKAMREGDIVWVTKDVVTDKEFDDWFLAKGTSPRWRRPLSATNLQKKRKEVIDRVVLEQVPHPQSAIFTADHTTGYVAAMVGGTDFDRSEYNRAYQSCRQPGSTYKAIYYSAALSRGYGFDTALNDIPRAEVDPETGQIWTPKNFQGTMDSKVSLEYAMVFSKNVASIDIFKKIGAKKVEQWARALGFSTEIIPDKALALGASCTLLHELTRAFAIFARNGKYQDWKWVRRIRDRNQNIVEDNTSYFDPMLTAGERLDRLYQQAGNAPKQAIPARTGFLTSKLLRQTIERGFSSILRQTGIVAAGKTGTSSATMDNTFVAYTSRWITTVWMGDDVRERPLGADDAAFMTVEPMWARYMNTAVAGHPNKKIPWVTPPGVKAHDRGDHSQGGIFRMPLVYLRPLSKSEPTIPIP